MTAARELWTEFEFTVSASSRKDLQVLAKQVAANYFEGDYSLTLKVHLAPYHADEKYVAHCTATATGDSPTHG